MPRQHGDNQYNTWCQQLGGKFGSVTYGQRFGRYVFGCTSHDDVNWHWCDWTDGYWYNQALRGGAPEIGLILDSSDRSTSDSITSLTCRGTIAGSNVNKYIIVFIYAIYEYLEEFNALFIVMNIFHIRLQVMPPPVPMINNPAKAPQYPAVTIPLHHYNRFRQSKLNS